MSSSFNTSEKWMARFLARFPRVKGVIKYFYRRVQYFFNRKSSKYYSSEVVREVAPQGYLSSFFGYYDRSPENTIGNILVHETQKGTADGPGGKEAILISVVNGSGDRISSVKTAAYNWQQGSRAIWLSSDRFIYNDFDPSQKLYVARIYSVSNNSIVASHGYPVQDAFSDRYYLSLNYRRLQALRPDYGYRNLPGASDAELRNLDRDGVWRVDIETGAVELIYTLAEADRLTGERAFVGGYAKFNHLMISPDGTQFLALHRRHSNGRRDDRLLVCGARGEGMKVLVDTGMVSHCSWVDTGTIIGFMRDREGRDGYRKVDIATGNMEVVAGGKLDKFGDGHPHARGDVFVTDTYPDRSAMQSLIMCNSRTGEIMKLGDFFHGLKFDGVARCDLHPRLSPDCKRVYFDSVFSGVRRLYSLELPEQ